MGPKKGKGKGGPVDGVDTTSMSREQLEAFSLRLKEELDREREERNFFQLERDKLRTFWEITRQQLEENRAQLRNQDREQDENEEKHQAEIKVYKQKVKHLLYEHQCNLSELKVESMVSLKMAQDEYIAMEQELLEDKRNLKLKLREQEVAHQEQIRQIKMEHSAEVSKLREQFSSDATEIERKYDARLSSQSEELGLQHSVELAEVEQRKNKQIVDLTKNHEQAFSEMKNYYNDITLNNLALISSLKEQMEELKSGHERMEKQLRDVQAENKRLVEPLKQARSELTNLQRQLASYEQDKINSANTKQRLALVTKELEDLRWENEVLELRFEKVEKERNRLHAEFVNAVLEVQQKSGLKSAMLEKKMSDLRGSVVSGGSVRRPQRALSFPPHFYPRSPRHGHPRTRRSLRGCGASILCNPELLREIQAGQDHLFTPTAPRVLKSPLSAESKRERVERWVADNDLSCSGSSGQSSCSCDEDDTVSVSKVQEVECEKLSDSNNQSRTKLPDTVKRKRRCQRKCRKCRRMFDDKRLGPATGVVRKTQTEVENVPKETQASSKRSEKSSSIVKRRGRRSPTPSPSRKAESRFRLPRNKFNRSSDEVSSRGPVTRYTKPRPRVSRSPDKGKEESATETSMQSCRLNLNIIIPSSEEVPVSPRGEADGNAETAEASTAAAIRKESSVVGNLDVPTVKVHGEDDILHHFQTQEETTESLPCHHLDLTEVLAKLLSSEKSSSKTGENAKHDTDPSKRMHLLPPVGYEQSIKRSVAEIVLPSVTMSYSKMVKELCPVHRPPSDSISTQSAVLMSTSQSVQESLKKYRIQMGDETESTIYHTDSLRTPFDSVTEFHITPSMATLPDEKPLEQQPTEDNIEFDDNIGQTFRIEEMLIERVPVARPSSIIKDFGSTLLGQVFGANLMPVDENADVQKFYEPEAVKQFDPDKIKIRRNDMRPVCTPYVESDSFSDIASASVSSTAKVGSPDKTTEYYCEVLKSDSSESKSDIVEQLKHRVAFSVSTHQENLGKLSPSRPDFPQSSTCAMIGGIPMQQQGIASKISQIESGALVGREAFGILSSYRTAESSPSKSGGQPLTPSLHTFFYRPVEVQVGSRFVLSNADLRESSAHAILSDLKELSQSDEAAGQGALGSISESFVTVMSSRRSHLAQSNRFLTSMEMMTPISSTKLIGTQPSAAPRRVCDDTHLPMAITSYSDPPLISWSSHTRMMANLSGWGGDGESLQRLMDRSLVHVKEMSESTLLDAKCDDRFSQSRDGQKPSSDGEHDEKAVDRLGGSRDEQKPTDAQGFDKPVDRFSKSRDVQKPFDGEHGEKPIDRLAESRAGQKPTDAERLDKPVDLLSKPRDVQKPFVKDHGEKPVDRLSFDQNSEKFAVSDRKKSPVGDTAKRKEKPEDRLSKSKDVQKPTDAGKASTSGGAVKRASSPKKSSQEMEPSSEVKKRGVSATKPKDNKTQPGARTGTGKRTGNMACYRTKLNTQTSTTDLDEFIAASQKCEKSTEIMPDDEKLLKGTKRRTSRSKGSALRDLESLSASEGSSPRGGPGTSTSTSEPTTPASGGRTRSSGVAQVRKQKKSSRFDALSETDSAESLPLPRRSRKPYSVAGISVSDCESRGIHTRSFTPKGWKTPSKAGSFLFEDDVIIHAHSPNIECDTAEDANLSREAPLPQRLGSIPRRTKHDTLSDDFPHPSRASRSRHSPRDINEPGPSGLSTPRRSCARPSSKSMQSLSAIITSFPPKETSTALAQTTSETSVKQSNDSKWMKFPAIVTTHKETMFHYPSTMKSEKKESTGFRSEQRKRRGSHQEFSNLTSISLSEFDDDPKLGSGSLPRITSSPMVTFPHLSGNTVLRSGSVSQHSEQPLSEISIHEIFSDDTLFYDDDSSESSDGELLTSKLSSLQEETDSAVKLETAKEGESLITLESHDQKSHSHRVVTTSESPIRLSADVKTSTQDASIGPEDLITKQKKKQKSHLLSTSEQVTKRRTYRCNKEGCFQCSGIGLTSKSRGKMGRSPKSKNPKTEKQIECSSEGAVVTLLPTLETCPSKSSPVCSDKTEICSPPHSMKSIKVPRVRFLDEGSSSHDFPRTRKSPTKSPDRINTLKPALSTKLAPISSGKIAGAGSSKKGQVFEEISSVKSTPSLTVIGKKGKAGTGSGVATDLEMQLARACKAHDELLAVYEAKLKEYGIPTDDLGLKPLRPKSKSGPTGLAAQNV